MLNLHSNGFLFINITQVDFYYLDLISPLTNTLLCISGQTYCGEYKVVTEQTQVEICSNLLSCNINRKF
jgi:hypothetical protein